MKKKFNLLFVKKNLKEQGLKLKKTRHLIFYCSRCAKNNNWKPKVQIFKYYILLFENFMFRS